MEIHRQTCQACGSKSLRSILVREPGKSDRAFLECDQCGELVARYIISPGGYYHHGKGYESYLRSLMRTGDEQMSGKNLKKQFQNVQEECLERYAKVKKYMKEHYKEEGEKD